MSGIIDKEDASSPEVKPLLQTKSPLELVMMSGQLSSDPKVNFQRLCLLLVEQGTKQTKCFVCGRFNSETDLVRSMKSKRKIFNDLKVKGVINERQFSLLFPPTPGMPPSLEEVDMTLWVIVLRNVTKNPRWIKWNERPGENDNLPQHDVLRLKCIRNDLFHMSTPEMSASQFTHYWQEVAQALEGLGTPKDTINRYANIPLDPNATFGAMYNVLQQTLEEQRCINVEQSKENRCMKIVACGSNVAFVITAMVFIAAILILLNHLKVEPQTKCRKAMNLVPRDGGFLPIMDRDAWGAVKPGIGRDPQRLPVKTVIIGHTASLKTCTDTEECCDFIKAYQDFHMNTFHWADVGYNYMIGGDGVIYEGRGTKWMGAHTKGWNNGSIGIAYIGKFIDSPPTAAALEAGQYFLDYLLEEGQLSPDYTVYGQCQVRFKFPKSPGTALYKKIQQWPHWGSREESWCESDVGYTVIPSQKP